MVDLVICLFVNLSSNQIHELPNNQQNEVKS